MTTFLKRARRCGLRTVLASASSAVCLVYVVRFAWLVGNSRICFNYGVLGDMDALCRAYHAGSISGSMCADACAEDGGGGNFEVLSCQGNHYGKHLVFHARLRGEEVIVKGERLESFFQPTTATGLHSNKVGSESATSSSPPSLSSNSNSSLWDRLWAGDVGGMDSREVFQAWHSNKHRELDISRRLSGHRILPANIARCGDVFAMEKAEPIDYPSYSSNLGDFLASRSALQQWEYRLRVAVGMLDLYRRIDRAPGSPFALCDVKYQHLGILPRLEGGPEDRAGDPAGAGIPWVVMLDADNFYPRAVANALVNTGAPCASDGDCDHFDCAGRCHPETRTCRSDGGVATSNLEILCEKIFVGRYKQFSVKYQPGLLESAHAGANLARTVITCADGGANSAKGDGKIRAAIQEELQRVRHLLGEQQR